jgi:hypothetical protein
MVPFLALYPNFAQSIFQEPYLSFTPLQTVLNANQTPPDLRPNVVVMIRFFKRKRKIDEKRSLFDFFMNSDEQSFIPFFQRL